MRSVKCIFSAIKIDIGYFFMRPTEVNTSQQHKSVGNREVNRGQQKSTEVNKNAFPNLEGIKRGQRRSTKINGGYYK